MAPAAVETARDFDSKPHENAASYAVKAHESLAVTKESSATATMSAVIDMPALETASKILHIIDRYRLKKSPGAPEKADEGALKFLALIYSHVKAGEAVPMCLPAFPFKSPNSTSKVLGKLPDRAEELALAHMNGLCQSIETVYAPGARLTIISDGLVYNGTSTTTQPQRFKMLFNLTD